MQCTLTKKSNVRRGLLAIAKKGDTPNAFQLQDNQDDTFTIFGVSAANPQVDISGVASLSVSSSDSTVVTADVATGMTDKVHGLKAGTSTLTIVASWNDNSVGPFTITVDVTIVADPNKVSGLAINWGTPTVR
jgi:hypothetical protein